MDKQFKSRCELEALIAEREAMITANIAKPNTYGEHAFNKLASRFRALQGTLASGTKRTLTEHYSANRGSYYTDEAGKEVTPEENDEIKEIK